MVSSGMGLVYLSSSRSALDTANSLERLVLGRGLRQVARIDRADDATSRPAYLWQSDCGHSLNGSLADLGNRPVTQGASLAGRRRACVALLQPSSLLAGEIPDFPLNNAAGITLSSE